MEYTRFCQKKKILNLPSVPSSSLEPTRTIIKGHVIEMGIEGFVDCLGLKNWV